MMSEDKDLQLRATLHSETARMSWNELQPFFAKGSTVFVSPDLDLIEVGMRFSRDDVRALSRWMDKGQVAPVQDDQACVWHANKSQLWALVIKPFVLVQPESE